MLEAGSDYEHKYVDDVVGLSCPADVPPPTLSAFADRVAPSCPRAWPTFDFFLNEDTDTRHHQQVNTLPGFTPISMYPQMWAAAGVFLPSTQRTAHRRLSAPWGCAEAGRGDPHLRVSRGAPRPRPFSQSDPKDYMTTKPKVTLVRGAAQNHPADC